MDKADSQEFLYRLGQITESIDQMAESFRALSEGMAVATNSFLAIGAAIAVTHNNQQAQQYARVLEEINKTQE